MPILEGLGVTKNFGGLTAVSNVDFHVEQGEIVGLIGPNGAGKTTSFYMIVGLIGSAAGILGTSTETESFRIIVGLPNSLGMYGRSLRKNRNWT